MPLDPVTLLCGVIDRRILGLENSSISKLVAELDELLEKEFRPREVTTICWPQALDELVVLAIEEVYKGEGWRYVSGNIARDKTIFKFYPPWTKRLWEEK